MGTFSFSSVRSDHIVILASGFYGVSVIVVSEEFREQVMLCTSLFKSCLLWEVISSTIMHLQMNPLPSFVRS